MKTRNKWLEAERRALTQAAIRESQKIATTRDREMRAARIYGAIRNHGRRFKYNPELTHEDVARLSSEPCGYCGFEDPVGCGVDRIDSTMGYLLANVVACCSECNIVLGDLPPPAKEVLAPGLRELRQHDYFGWTAPVRRKGFLKALTRMDDDELEEAVAPIRDRIAAERERYDEAKDARHYTAGKACGDVPVTKRRR